MLTNCHLQKTWVKGSFFFFFPFLFSLSQGNAWSLHLSRFYCPKKLPEPFTPAAQALITAVGAGIPVPSVSFPAPFSCCVMMSQPGAVCRGLRWSGAETSNHRLRRNECVGRILPTLVIFQALPQLLLVAVCRRESASAPTGLWAFLYFSRWTKKVWAMFGLYFSRLLWFLLSVWHLSYTIKIT